MSSASRAFLEQRERETQEEIYHKQFNSYQSWLLQQQTKEASKRESKYHQATMSLDASK